MFFVIDSIDGGGSETQGKLVAKALEKQGKEVSIKSFPEYKSAIGKTIREFLYENKSLPVEQQFLLYSLQFVVAAEAITKESKKDIVIADRYFTTTLVYQTLQGMSEEVCLRFARDFGIIVPQVVFFLDVSPETAYKWKHGEGKQINRWEQDLAFMKKTYKKYSDLCDRQVFAKWIRINGEQSKEAVTKEILSHLKLFFERA